MLKRAADIVMSLVGLVVLGPLILVLALMIRNKLGSPVLFRQARPGLHGKTFTILKFRSMTDARDASGKPLPDMERLPAFGRWLRSTSLDELPSLFNVLAGDMSMVGPRPLLVEYLERYDSRQKLRHNLKPGVTGWAQVNGRNAVTWPKKLEMDVWYVENQSFLLDMRIIFLTIFKVLRRKDVNNSSQETMPAFTGTEGHNPE